MPGKRQPRPKADVKQFDRLLTLENVGEILGLSPGAVRRKIQHGKLPAVKLGRDFRVRMSALQAFIQALPAVAPEEYVWDRMLAQ